MLPYPSCSAGFCFQNFVLHATVWCMLARIVAFKNYFSKSLLTASCRSSFATIIFKATHNLNWPRLSFWIIHEVTYLSQCVRSRRHSGGLSRCHGQKIAFEPGRQDWVVVVDIPSLQLQRHAGHICKSFSVSGKVKKIYLVQKLWKYNFDKLVLVLIAQHSLRRKGLAREAVFIGHDDSHVDCTILF